MQYLKKELSDAVGFLHADNHESFLQSVTMIFEADGHAFPKLPKKQVSMALQYLKKEVRDEVDFLHADKYQKFPTS